jgi:ATP-binding cassette subfamily C protein EexD
MKDTKNTIRYKELFEGFKAVRQYFILAGVYSAAINILMLVPIMYMMLVYDRVVASGSISTLAMLTLIMVFLMAAMGGFEWVRSMILVSAGNKIEKNLRDRVFNASFKQALYSGGSANGSQASNDLSQLRQFLTGNGLFAFFDAPWFPVYVIVMFMFHPLFGVTAIVAGIVMVALAYVTEKVTTSETQGRQRRRPTGSTARSTAACAMWKSSLPWAC